MSDHQPEAERSKQMRKIVLAMNTTLNGRLDDPFAWIAGMSDDLCTEIDRAYATFDTILVGRASWMTGVTERRRGRLRHEPCLDASPVR